MFVVEGARRGRCGSDAGGEGDTHRRWLRRRRRRRKRGREGEVTVPRADFHELRNRRRTARPWHRLPLIFYCPYLRRCCRRSPRRFHAAADDDDGRRLTIVVTMLYIQRLQGISLRRSLWQISAIARSARLCRPTTRYATTPRNMNRVSTYHRLVTGKNLSLKPMKIN